jgi:hypothetical protein
MAVSTIIMRMRPGQCVCVRVRVRRRTLIRPLGHGERTGAADDTPEHRERREWYPVGHSI